MAKTTMDANEMIKQIREGDKVGMMIYLRSGGDPNARNHMGYTLLHIACLEGQEEITKVLLEAKASVNCCTTDMCTPLHCACTRGNRDTVEVLLKHGAYINAQDKTGCTPLHEAAKGLHTSTVKLLIEKKADRSRVNKKNQIFTDMIGQQLMPTVECGDIDVLVSWMDWGLSANTFGNLNWSLLQHASARGQINIASILIERGAEVNTLDCNRSTPLHAACFYGYLRIAQLLIQSGADINAQDHRGNTPLHSSISGAHPEIVNLLLENGCDTTIANNEGQIFTHLVNEFLIEAVQKNTISHIVSLLKGKANPNTRDFYGNPVLCFAAFKGELLAVDALLEAGADANITSKDNNKTPLHYAAGLGHFFVAKSLLDKNASLSAKDNHNVTPLHEATAEGHEDIITVLCGRCAPLNAQDNEGNTPLHMAGRWGQQSTIEQLIEKGADESIRNNAGLLYSDLALMRAVRTEDANQVIAGLAWGGDPDVQDKKGWTLLHHAVYKGALEVCNVLLESEANVNIQDKHGRTALLLAAYRGNLEIMKLLLDAGADPDIQDIRGQTPLHWAADEGSSDAVHLLLDRGANGSLRNKNSCLYSTLLLKHLYFAVRHNDSLKVESLLRAGADQTAELRGTGITPRDEAKRRKLYPILRKMISMAPKKSSPPPNRESQLALEDVGRLFEECDADSSSDEEDEYDPDEDAYWRMHNASMVINAKDLFEDEEKSFWENWEEKPQVIPAKELNKEELEEFWSNWKEEKEVISAKEFFNEDNKPWWETSSSSSDESTSVSEDKMLTFEELKKKWGEVIPAVDFFREDECWWRDAVEDQDEPKIISAKEFFKDERPWWENSGSEDEAAEGSASQNQQINYDQSISKTEEEHQKQFDNKEAKILDEDKKWKKEESECPIEEDFEESVTEDWETANESVFSDSSTMYSFSDGDKISAAELFAERPWWETNDDDDDTADILQSDGYISDEENTSDLLSEITEVNDFSNQTLEANNRRYSVTESECSTNLLDSYDSEEILNDYEQNDNGSEILIVQANTNSSEPIVQDKDNSAAGIEVVHNDEITPANSNQNRINEPQSCAYELHSSEEELHSNEDDKNFDSVSKSFDISEQSDYNENFTNRQPRSVSRSPTTKNEIFISKYVKEKMIGTNKFTVNKMDDCLAKVDARLAILEKDKIENDCPIRTYLNEPQVLFPSDKQIIPKPKEIQEDNYSKDNLQFELPNVYRISVNIPKQLVSQNKSPPPDDFHKLEYSVRSSDPKNKELLGVSPIKSELNSEGEAYVPSFLLGFDVNSIKKKLPENFTKCNNDAEKNQHPNSSINENTKTVAELEINYNDKRLSNCSANGSLNCILTGIDDLSSNSTEIQNKYLNEPINKISGAESDDSQFKTPLLINGSIKKEKDVITSSSVVSFGSFQELCFDHCITHKLETKNVNELSDYSTISIVQNTPFTSASSTAHVSPMIKVVQTSESHELESKVSLSSVCNPRQEIEEVREGSEPEAKALNELESPEIELKCNMQVDLKTGSSSWKCKAINSPTDIDEKVTSTNAKPSRKRSKSESSESSSNFVFDCINVEGALATSPSECSSSMHTDETSAVDSNPNNSFFSTDQQTTPLASPRRKKQKNRLKKELLRAVEDDASLTERNRNQTDIETKFLSDSGLKKDNPDKVEPHSNLQSESSYPITNAKQSEDNKLYQKMDKLPKQARSSSCVLN